MVVAATTTSRSERMRVWLQSRCTLAVACAVAFGLLIGCANKRHASEQASVGAALPDLPEPPGVLAELRLAHPDATFRALRELGRPLSSLLPAGFPMLSASLLGLPPLTADSFDPELPVVGVLTQNGASAPGWVLALHAMSGPELVAKLCTGNHAPFRAVAGGVAGLQRIEPSSAPSRANFSLGVFDQYLLVASTDELLKVAGPYVARTLPRRPPARASQAPLALRFSQHALESNLVPALRALWASYRTGLSHLDQSARSAHGGRAPDFGDPAQVILGADAVVESLLSLLDGAALLELELEPSPNRLEVTLVLEPGAGSEVQAKLGTLAGGTAQGLLTLPAETQFALGLSRTNEERELAGKVAGDDWVRLLGARLSAGDAQQLRAVLSDWELGRSTQTRYGFLGGGEPGAFLVTGVADATRMKRAASGLFGLLAVPGLRAPLVEFIAQPRVVEGAPGVDLLLPNVSRKKLLFSPSGGRKVAPGPLSFAWLVEPEWGFAAASKDADRTLKAVLQSAHGERPTLAEKAGIAEAVQRIGDQAALFAYLDARVLGGLAGSAATLPAPLLLALGKRGPSGYLRLEIAKPAVDLALSGMLGQ